MPGPSTRPDLGSMLPNDKCRARRDGASAGVRQPMRTSSGVSVFTQTVSSRIDAKSSTWSGHDKRSPRTIWAAASSCP
jgi:hypothetical protein